MWDMKVLYKFKNPEEEVEHREVEEEEEHVKVPIAASSSICTV